MFEAKRKLPEVQRTISTMTNAQTSPHESLQYIICGICLTLTNNSHTISSIMPIEIMGRLFEYDEQWRNIS